MNWESIYDAVTDLKTEVDSAIDHLTYKNDELHDKNAALMAALQAVEWNPHTLYCPWCGMGEEDGHADDCQRQQALELGKYKP